MMTCLGKCDDGYSQLEPPLTAEVLPAVIPDLQARSDEKFAQEYAELLLISNGVQIENAIIFDIHTLYDALAPETDTVVIGNNDNLDTYLYHLSDKCYHTVNFYDESEVFARSSSLQALLKRIQGEQGIVVSS